MEELALPKQEQQIPNTAFAEYGARANTPAGPTGDVSPRRGTGLSGGPGARGGGSQSGF